MKGAQKTYAVADCRVSDPVQLKGGSLELQEMAAQLLAQKNGWIIDKVFRKPHSATTTEREDIEEVLTYIRKRRTEGVFITKYVCKSIDRLTRMGDREYWNLKDKLEEVGVELVDTTGIIQPKRNTLEHLGEQYRYSWSVYSPSEAAESFEAQKSKAEARDILTRLVGAEIKLVQDGFAVREAPDGLKNKTIFIDGKKRVVREASDRAHYFQEMFRLLAEGMDYPETVARINALGFRTRTYNRWDRSNKEHPRIVGKSGGKMLTTKQLQRYVQQTEYAGINYEKWTKHRPVKMQEFDGIVSVDIFNRANRGKIYIDVQKDGSIEIKHNYSVWGKIKRLRDNPKYPWKCLLCPLCKSEMLASASKGKSGATFDGYHCGGAKSGKRAHKYMRIKQDEFEKNVREYLDSLKFESAFLAGLEIHLITKYRQREKEILVESSAISRSVSDLKAELAKKLDAFSMTESQTIRKMLESQVEELDRQIQDAERTRRKIEITEKSIRSFVRYAKYVMEHPAEILTSADNLYTRRTLLGLFFEEIPTYHEIVSGTPKLQPLFKLSEEFKRDKTQLVTPRGIEPRLQA